MTGEVPPRDRGDELASRDDLRASHEDRDRVVDVLRVAAGDGRLTAEELDERLEVAFTARTYGELAAVIRDLTVEPGLAAGGASLVPKELDRIECRGSTATRAGRWLLPQRMQVLARNSHVTLDFTEAVISQPAVFIDADMSGSYLALVTRPGIAVNTDDVVTDQSAAAVREPWGPDVPVILRVHVSGKLSASHITARPRRPPRRTFWNWLRRRPRGRAIAPP